MDFQVRCLPIIFKKRATTTAPPPLRVSRISFANRIKFALVSLLNYPQTILIETDSSSPINNNIGRVSGAPREVAIPFSETHILPLNVYEEKNQCWGARL